MAFCWYIFDEIIDCVLRRLKVQEKFYVLSGKRRQEGVVTGGEDYGIHKLYVWDDCVETRRDSSNIKKGQKDIFKCLC